MKTRLLRLLWVLLGSSVAISLALWVTKTNSPLLLASLGGTTLFLFALTTAPAAQPRAVFGAHLISSLVGILAYQLFGDAFWVYVIALVVTIGILLVVRCVHPPAGANPLIMIQAHASFIHLGVTVLLGVTIIFVVAYIWSRLGVGVRKYPISWTQPSPPSLNWSIWDHWIFWIKNGQKFLHLKPLGIQIMLFWYKVFLALLICYPLCELLNLFN